MSQVTNDQLLQEWKQSMEVFVVQDIRTSLDADLLGVGLIILTLVGIDCISGYFAGKPSENSTFVSFVTSNYFPVDYHNIAGELYNLRSGLIHDYTIKFDKFHFFRNIGDGHQHLGQVLTTNKGSQITLNREHFARDFIKAWESYSNDVFVNPDLAAKALARIGEKGTRIPCCRRNPSTEDS